MKIGIDASDLTNDPAGIGYVTRGIIEGLTEFPEHEYVIYLREESELTLPANFQLVVIPPVSKFLGGGITRNLRLARDASRRQLAWLIMPSLNILPLFFKNILVVLYDLTPLTSPQFYSRLFTLRFKSFLFLSLQRSRAFSSISELTKQETYRLFPKFKKEVSVIPLGINNWVQNRPSQDEIQQTKRKYGLPENYFFSLSTLQPRKNYENMIRAFALFHQTHPEFQYLIGGKPGWYFGKIYRVVHELDLDKSVRFLGYVPEEDLSVLMGQAKAFLYVSFAEGFGLPIIEAIACGVPVVTSDLPIFHELVKPEQAIFVRPDDVTGIARGLEQMILRQRVKVEASFWQKYTWRNAAGTLLQIMAKSS